MYAFKLTFLTSTQCYSPYLLSSENCFVCPNYKLQDQLWLPEKAPYSTAKYFTCFHCTHSIKENTQNNMLQQRHGKWNRSSKDTAADNHHVNINRHNAILNKKKLQLPFRVRLLLNAFLAFYLTVILDQATSF